MIALPLILATASIASAAVCPRGFLIHPEGNKDYCLSVPGAEDVQVWSEYTLGVLVEPCRPNVLHQAWRWFKDTGTRNGQPVETILLQNLAGLDKSSEEDADVKLNFCVGSGYYIGTDTSGRPTQAKVGDQLTFTVCDWANPWPGVDRGQSWRQKGDQIVGNPIIDGNGQQKEQCLDVRDGNLDNGVVQMWYCDEADQNTNQKWTVEPL